MPITLRYRQVSADEVPGAFSEFEALEGRESASYDRQEELDQGFIDTPAPGAAPPRPQPQEQAAPPPPRPQLSVEPPKLTRREPAAFIQQRPAPLAQQYKGSGYNVAGGFKELVKGFVRLPKAIAAAAASALQGYDGASVIDEDFGDRLVKSSGKDSERAINEAAQRYGKSKWIPGIAIEDIVNLPSSLAASLVSAGTGVTAGLATAAGTAAIPVPGARVVAPRLGWAAGTAAAGTAAYQMTGYEVMKEYLNIKNEESQEKFGRTISRNEENAFKKDFAATAQKIGLWEAIPEAVGQATGLGIVFDKLVKVAGRSAATRIISKLAAFYGEEEITEMITYIGTKNERIEAGLDEGTPLNWIDPGAHVQAFKATFPTTFLLTTIMGGAAVSSQSIYKNRNAQKDAVIIKDAVAERGYEALSTSELEQLVTNVEKTAKIRSNDGKLQNAVTELKDHLAERTGPEPTSPIQPAPVEPTTAPVLQTTELTPEEVPAEVRQQLQAKPEPTQGTPVLKTREVTQEEFAAEAPQSAAALAAAEAARSKGEFTEAELTEDVPEGIAERRQNTAMREAARLLSTENLAALFFTDELTSLGNKRSMATIPEKKFKAFIDLDSLKWVNDNVGHEAGDNLLKTAGAAFANTDLADNAFHLSGDEFALQADSREELDAAVEQARAYLESNALQISEDSREITLPVQFSYGVAETLKEADQLMNADKKDREKAGLRGVREGTPVGVTIIEKGAVTPEVGTPPAPPTTPPAPPIPQKPGAPGPKRQPQAPKPKHELVNISNTAYAENRAQKKGQSFVKNTGRTILDFTSEVAKGLDRYLGAISTRLANINPELKFKLREVDFNTSDMFAKDVSRALPMLEAASKKMSKNDFIDWDYARRNSDATKIRELAKRYGIEQEYVEYRALLDDIRKEALDVGLDIGYIEDYSPRNIKDVKGFLREARKGTDWDVITRGLKAAAAKLDVSVAEMPKDLQASIVSNIVLGGSTGMTGIAATKHRKLRFIPAKFDRYYDHSDAALMSYIHSVRKNIEARKFFGKMPERVSNLRKQLRTAQTKQNKLERQGLTEGANKQRDLAAEYQWKLDQIANQRDFSANIGAYIIELMADGKIDDSKQRELQEILTARFNERGPTGIVKAAKNVALIDVMGSVYSTLTQVADLAWSMYDGGMIATVKNASKSLVGASRLKKAEVGFTHIAQEFADPGSFGKAVNIIFTASGLSKMDGIGKEALMNTALEKYEKRSKKDVTLLSKELAPVFGGETASVIADLQKGAITDNVRLLIYNKVLDFQPMALSEMPEKYLTAGNGRVAYMLKTFTLKQLDVYRNEIYNKLRSSDRATQRQGLKNFARLAIFFVMANAGADELKDWMLGRESSLSDKVIENALRLGGISKYITWQARTEGVGTALSRQVLPPFRFVDNLFRDTAAITGVEDKYREFTGRPPKDFKGLRSVGSIPIVGKLYEWRFGIKSEAAKKSRKKQLRKRPVRSIGR